MNDPENRVGAFKGAALYFIWTSRIIGPLLLLVGIVGLVQQRLAIVAFMALLLGLMACGFGMMKISIRVGHVHWSTEHAREERRFRRAMRKELG